MHPRRGTWVADTVMAGHTRLRHCILHTNHSQRDIAIAAVSRVMTGTHADFSIQVLKEEIQAQGFQ